MDGIKELKNCPFISFQEMKNAFLDRNINIGVDVNRYTREFVRNNPWTNAILFLIIIALAYPLVIGRWWLLFTFFIWLIIASYGILPILICGTLIWLIFSANYLLIFFLIVVAIRFLYGASNNFTQRSIINKIINDEDLFCNFWNSNLICIKNKSGEIFRNR